MEQWRDIPSYEGIYEVSNLGNIRSCFGKTTYTDRSGVRHWKQRIMKQKITRNGRGRGDARVSLWRNGKEKTWLVARLVGLAWCKGYAEGMTINHINGDSLDNRAKNLEWVTLAENIQKGFAEGLYAKMQKVVVLISDDGKSARFDSMSEASRFLGRNKGYVSDRTKKDGVVRSMDGKKYTVYYEEKL